MKAMNVKTMGLLAGLVLGGSALAQSAPMQAAPPKQSPPQQGKMMGEHSGQKELTGKVVGVEEKELLVQMEGQGAIVELKVSHDTMLDGKELKKDQLIESHLKKEFKPGDEVRVSYEIQKMENQAISIQRSTR